MNNVEKLKEMINLLAENHISNDDAMLAYLASIATSLAVIADKLTMKEAMHDQEAKPEEDEVIKAMETIKQFCKDCDQCHGCRFRNREWGKRCLLNEDIPAYWKYYKEEGEQNE